MAPDGTIPACPKSAQLRVLKDLERGALPHQRSCADKDRANAKAALGRTTLPIKWPTPPAEWATLTDGATPGTAPWWFAHTTKAPDRILAAASMALHLFKDATPQHTSTQAGSRMDHGSISTALLRNIAASYATPIAVCPVTGFGLTASELCRVDYMCAEQETDHVTTVDTRPDATRFAPRQWDDRLPTSTTTPPNLLTIQCELLVAYCTTPHYRRADMLQTAYVAWAGLLHPSFPETLAAIVATMHILMSDVDAMFDALLTAPGREAISTLRRAIAKLVLVTSVAKRCVVLPPLQITTAMAAPLAALIERRAVLPVHTFAPPKIPLRFCGSAFKAGYGPFAAASTLHTQLTTRSVLTFLLAMDTRSTFDFVIDFLADTPEVSPPPGVPHETPLETPSATLSAVPVVQPLVAYTPVSTPSPTDELGESPKKRLRSCDETEAEFSAINRTVAVMGIYGASVYTHRSILGIASRVQIKGPGMAFDALLEYPRQPIVHLLVYHMIPLCPRKLVWVESLACAAKKRVPACAALGNAMAPNITMAQQRCPTHGCMNPYHTTDSTNLALLCLAAELILRDRLPIVDTLHADLGRYNEDETRLTREAASTLVDAIFEEDGGITVPRVSQWLHTLGMYNPDAEEVYMSSIAHSTGEDVLRRLADRKLC
jgi:hypothetical protein